MKRSKVILLLLLTVSLLSLKSSSYYVNGLYEAFSISYNNVNYSVFDFSRKGTKIRAKYFARNAYHEYSQWSRGKKILFLCSGAYSNSWAYNATPVGVCVDNGDIVNRNVDSKMDGMVIVYNGGAQVGGIAVVNIEKEPVTVKQGQSASYYMNNHKDKNKFLNWARNQNATVFQTHLMYSKSYGNGFSNSKLRYGKRAERRFLAICTDRNGTVHHIVVDRPNSEYMNKAASEVVNMLQSKLNYTIYGLFNLDTGGKNIMKAYNDKGRIIAQTVQSESEATNMLVYYTE